MNVRVDAGSGKVLAMEQDYADNDDHGPMGRYETDETGGYGRER